MTNVFVGTIEKKSHTHTHTHTHTQDQINIYHSFKSLL